MSVRKIFSWAVRIIAAVIMLQTLYFKFTGQPESVALFSKLGIEPWGRIGTGVMELIASILLLLPTTVFMGALLGLGLMSGAILSHLFVLGIESQGDGGQLFLYAIIVWVCCAIALLLHFKQGQSIYFKLLKK